MTPRFLECFRLTDILEGGPETAAQALANNDSGGATGNGGWSQGSYDSYRTSIGQPLQSVLLSTLSERRDCYFRDYFKAYGCHLLGSPLDFIFYQRVLNMSAKYATIDLQEALGVAVDLKVGPDTAAAAEHMGWADTAILVLTAQSEAYRSIVLHSNMLIKEWVTDNSQGAKPLDQRENGPGWLNRCTHAAVLAGLTWSPDERLTVFMNKQHADFKAGILPI